MNITSLYNLIVGVSPTIEVFFRKLYWTNVSKTSRLSQKPTRTRKDATPINFDRIIENIKHRGVGEGKTIIIHSSYDLLENSGLSPEEINSKLLQLVGREGTLVMPVIRRYKEEGRKEEYLTTDLDNVVCTYNVQKSKIVSGLLPFTLMQRDDCHVSRFPLNPIVAIGKYAEEMIKHNLEGDEPTPHGPKSSWKFCFDKEAIVIGLGVDMPHYLTITHVHEECSKNWPIKNWYRKRIFDIIDKDFTTRKEVLERKPIWGTMYFAEKKYRKDLLKNDILKIENVEGLNISIIESTRLLNFLNAHPHKGYPYYVESKFLK